VNSTVIKEYEYLLHQEVSFPWRDYHYK